MGLQWREPISVGVVDREVVASREPAGWQPGRDTLLTSREYCHCEAASLCGMAGRMNGMQSRQVLRSKTDAVAGARGEAQLCRQ